MAATILQFEDFIVNIADVSDIVLQPQYDQIVEKNQCLYCFDTEDDYGGLFICLKTYTAYCLRHVMIPASKNVRGLFLNILRKKKNLEELDLANNSEFDPSKDAFNVEYYLVYITADMDFFKTSYNPSNCDRTIDIAAKYVINSSSSLTQHSLKIWSKKKPPISKHAENLLQFTYDKRFPDRDSWKCEACGLKSNLWLNLTDGRILCGRKQYNGADGNCHALLHYKETLYPLSVKLGTISPMGADVYSYPEDEIVTDPYLVAHLANFCIEMAAYEPTEKSTQLLELENNLFAMSLSKDTVERGNFGGCSDNLFMGLKNLGNSCYMNSLIRLFCGVSEFKKILAVDPAVKFLTGMDNLSEDIGFQLMKVVYHIENSAAISRLLKKDNPLSELEIYSLKSALCKENSAFISNGQQDVAEFLYYFLEKYEKYSKMHKLPEFNFRNLFLFKQHSIQLPTVEHSFEDIEVIENDEIIIQIPVAGLESAEGNSGISWLNALDEGSLVCKNDSLIFNIKTKMKTFPKYLLIQLNSFNIQSDFTFDKLNIEVEMPLTLDLSCLVSIMEPTVKMGENTKIKKPVNQNIFDQMLQMGFDYEKSEEASCRCNTLDEAITWVLENESVSKEETMSDLIAKLVSHGFEEEICRLCLIKNNEKFDETLLDLQLGITYDDLAMFDESQSSKRYDVTFTNEKNAKYQMKGFICHEGASMSFGHYVTYLNKDNDWYIFDDSSILQSLYPPLNKGYIYLYERLE